ncbi:hypothetical protein Csa_000713 [Cucumis sativus]|uniref:Uncharacterized protein n=1 Tax=Cucumis sativus TaxID=3659 RepID=A0A0A0L8Z8_CUCSA|nr:hypothetical protein Csa_000713 [Cucumis sativus]
MGRNAFTGPTATINRLPPLLFVSVPVLNFHEDFRKSLFLGASKLLKELERQRMVIKRKKKNLKGANQSDVRRRIRYGRWENGGAEVRDLSNRDR